MQTYLPIHSMLDYLQPWVNCQSLPSMDKSYRTRITALPRMRGLTSVGKRSGSSRLRSLTSIQSMVWQQVNSLTQCKFSTQCAPVLPPLFSSTLPWPEGHPITAYVFFLVIQCFLSVLFMLCSVIFSSVTLCSTSYTTRLVQLITFLQHQTSKIFRYFCLSKVSQVSTPVKAVFQMHFIGLFLRLKASFLLKRVFLLNADFSTAILDLISSAPLASLLCYKNSLNISLSPDFYLL